MDRIKMKNRKLQSWRAEDTVEQLLKRRSCFFLTLTTPKRVELIDIREMWRNFRHDFARLLHFNYIMNYELHPRGHGWHIHAIIDKYLPLRKYLSRIHKHGFGRTNIKVATTKTISDYLTKHIIKAYRQHMFGEASLVGRKYRLRLINVSRCFPPLCSYHCISDIVRRQKEIFRQNKNNKWWRSLDFRKKIFFSEVCAWTGETPENILKKMC